MPECTTTNFSNCVSIKKRIYAFALGTSTLILSKFSTVKTHFPSSIEEHNIGNIANGSLPLNSTTPPLAGESPIDITFFTVSLNINLQLALFSVNKVLARHNTLSSFPMNGSDNKNSTLSV